MGIFRKSRGSDSWDLPEGMGLAGAAAHVVKALQHREMHERHYDGTALDYIEVVEVDVEAETAPAREPGILMSWRQRDQRFGLVASIGSLLQQSGGLDRLVDDLWHIIESPHPGDASVRTWFAAVPATTSAQ